jgi:hypothetical protein
MCPATPTHHKDAMCVIPDECARGVINYESSSEPPGCDVAGYSLNRDVAQPGRALAWGARGRQFKSARPDQFKIDVPPRGDPSPIDFAQGQDFACGLPLRSRRKAAQVQICPSRPIQLSVISYQFSVRNCRSCRSRTDQHIARSHRGAHCRGFRPRRGRHI